MKTDILALALGAAAAYVVLNKPTSENQLAASTQAASKIVYDAFGAIPSIFSVGQSISRTLWEDLGYSYDYMTNAPTTSHIPSVAYSQLTNQWASYPGSPAIGW